jgi:DNA-binding NarL/FixJ family response regulator
VKCDGLTPRQLEVARLIADCLTVKQIAATLHVTRQSIEDHVEAIVVAWQLDTGRDVAIQIALRYKQRHAA